MRILFFSDIHLAAHEDFSYVLPNGDNNRLADLLSIIDRIPAIYQKYQADMVLFGGDLFHHPRSINTQTYQKAYEAMERMCSTVERIFIIAGNHDQALFQKQSATALYPLKRLPNTEVILTQHEVVFSDGTIVNLMPYTEHKEQVLDCLKRVHKGSVLLGHCGLTEATIGPNEIKIEAPINLQDIAALDLEMAAFGHYHKPQSFEGNAFIIGAPAQHNMLDRGEKRGLLFYDTKTHEAKRIWMKGPKFHLYEVANADNLKALKATAPELTGGYVRVLLRSKTINKDEIVELLDAAGVKSHQVRYAVQTEASQRNIELTTKLLGCGLDDSLTDYVAHVEVDGLDKNRLVQTGQQLLKEYETQ